MRGRAAKKKADSMDLLLDTICNTFGGVLFIALLVVMLVQASPANRAKAAHTAEPTLLQQHAVLTQELAALQSQIDRLEAARRGQLRTLGALAPSEVCELLESRTRKDEQARSLRAEGDRLKALIASISQEVAVERENAANARVGLERARSEVERLKKELQSVKDSRVKELRTPVVRQPGLKSEIAMVLQYGRLYVWHRYDAFGNRRGLNTEDFLITGSTAEGVETTPRPTRGVSVSAAPAARRQIAAVLGRFNASSQYPAFAVRPDSYDEFEIVRDIALELGFDYRLMPLETEESIRDRGGRGLVQ